MIKNKHRITITIGIPAFNEETNILYLLSDLLAQVKKSFILSSIIVCSDGSTDATVRKAKEIKSPKIIVIDNKKRLGRAVRQNQIMQKANGDVLVLVDADIQIKDKFFLEKIIKPAALGKADLTSVSVMELKPQTFLGKVLEVSMKFKKYIFENFKKGNNLFTCHGRARAFSRKLYKTIKFKESVGEDAYSYFFTVSKGFKYKFVRGTEIYYRLPESFSDHEKQSLRFYKTLGLLQKDFGKELVEKENFVNSVVIINNLVKYFFVNPLIFVYFLIATFLKIKSLLMKDVSNAWSISQSSKILRSKV